MSLVKRLRLDEIVTSYPELGPTAPDGGYSWLILLGVAFIQVRSSHIYLHNKVALSFRYLHTWHLNIDSLLKL